MTFLMGLNDSYAQVRGQILFTETLPPINNVFSLIIQEEKQRKIGSPHKVNHAMAFLPKHERHTITGAKQGQKKERS